MINLIPCIRLRGQGQPQQTRARAGRTRSASGNLRLWRLRFFGQGRVLGQEYCGQPPAPKIVKNTD